MDCFTATTLCKSLSCEYDCKPSLDGGVCTCPDGKKLSNDTKTCLDLDECAEWGYCDQKCVNKVGRYDCTCVAGYERRDDKCVALPNSPKMVLYFAHYNKILKVDMDGGSPTQVSNASMAAGEFVTSDAFAVIRHFSYFPTSSFSHGRPRFHVAYN